MVGTVLLPNEVAVQLRCSRRQVYDLFEEGELLGFKVGRHIKIHADSVKDFIDRNSNRPPPLNDLGSVKEPLDITPPPPPRAKSRATQTPVGYRHLRPGPRTSSS